MRRFFSLSLVVAAGLAIPAGHPARAVEFTQRATVFPERDYTCRFDGDDVRLGERRCLRTDGGMHLAQCAIVLNMSSWQAVGEPCP